MRARAAAASPAARAAAAPPVPAEVRQALAHAGQPLEARARGDMESRFQHDFSGVRVHADGGAARAAAAVDARAFTVGSHIVFGAGEYAPGTARGARVLAHELVHTVQQRGAAPHAGAPLAVSDPSGAVEREAARAGTRAAAGERVRVAGAAPLQLARDPAPAAPSAPPAETPELKKKLDAIAAEYAKMIAAARAKGANVAADNLQHFLDGKGGIRTLSVTWLRSFSDLRAAERTNQSRFESSLDDEAVKVPAKGSRTFTDHWSRMFTASVFDELYYASGTSTIKSTGSFTLSAPVAKEVDVTGTVRHHWYDPYDWHADLSTYIPGSGTVSDQDALLMQKHRGAKPFDMQADWDQTLSGHVKVRDYWFDTSKYTWSGP
ncbi:MAG TPA: DUF4157 domain-containing protein [Longimicrobium sp.]